MASKGEQFIPPTHHLNVDYYSDESDNEYGGYGYDDDDFDEPQAPMPPQARSDGKYKSRHYGGGSSRGHSGRRHRDDKGRYTSSRGQPQAAAAHSVEPHRDDRYEDPTSYRYQRQTRQYGTTYRGKSYMMPQAAAAPLMSGQIPASATAAAAKAIVPQHAEARRGKDPWGGNILAPPRMPEYEPSMELKPDGKLTLDLTNENPWTTKCAEATVSFVGTLPRFRDGEGVEIVVFSNPMEAFGFNSQSLFGQEINREHLEHGIVLEVKHICSQVVGGPHNEYCVDLECENRITGEQVKIGQCTTPGDPKNHLLVVSKGIENTTIRSLGGFKKEKHRFNIQGLEACYGLFKDPQLLYAGHMYIDRNDSTHYFPEMGHAMGLINQNTEFFLPQAAAKNMTYSDFHAAQGQILQLPDGSRRVPVPDDIWRSFLEQIQEDVLKNSPNCDLTSMKLKLSLPGGRNFTEPSCHLSEMEKSLFEENSGEETVRISVTCEFTVTIPATERVIRETKAKLQSSAALAED